MIKILKKQFHSQITFSSHLEMRPCTHQVLITYPSSLSQHLRTLHSTGIWLSIGRYDGLVCIKYVT